DADLGLENDGQQAKFIDATYKHAESFSLLINAVKMRFVNQIRDGLVGQVRARGQRGNGGEVETAGIALAADEKTAFINNQRCGGIGLLQQFAQLLIEPLNVFLD